MAKRKRLTPANPDYLTADGPAPEIKSMYPMGGRRSYTSAPIADVVGQNASTAALEEVADTLRRAREEGRMVLDLPLAAVDESHLVRDRTRIDDEEMASLRASIEARGQQTPIEVTDLGNGRYGLISGWRRLAALRHLSDEKPGAFETVQALLRRPDQSADAYLAMVEENEIRAGLSYYERARIAARAVEQGVFETPKAALLSLYRNASRAKRSKIRSFLVLVAELDGVLRFPEDLSERLGLRVSGALSADPAAAESFRRGVQAANPATAEDEKACLEALLTPASGRASAPPAPMKNTPRPGLTMERKGDNHVVLRGPAMDAELYKSLLAFLSAAD